MVIENPAEFRDTIDRCTKDARLTECRSELARYAAGQFDAAGKELHVLGHVLGSDRETKSSPWGHGSDETVAVSVLLRIEAQLMWASEELISDGLTYAAAALARQMVEIEYLACAFETRDREAERWLRSSRSEREMFFRPAKLRKAAGAKFRSADYGYHCELGGHPVPSGTLLLGNSDSSLQQLLLADILGHAGRIWDHMIGWAQNSPHGQPAMNRGPGMLERFLAWKSMDPLANLPAPPGQELWSLWRPPTPGK